MKNIIIISALSLFLSGTAAGADPNAAPQGVGTDLSFLDIINSAQANGMGGCVANMVNEEAPLYNPGAMGLFHLNKNLAATYSFKTNWMPQFIDDTYTKSFCIGAGLSSHDLHLHSEGKLIYALSMAYSQFRFEGNAIGIFDYTDKADYYTIAAGVDYYIRIGAGYSQKKIAEILDSDLDEWRSDNRFSAHDYGFIIEVPVMELLRPVTKMKYSLKPSLRFTVTPSFAYTKANIGHDVYYEKAAVSYPLPKTSRTGIAINSAIDCRRHRLASLFVAMEREKDLSLDRKIDKFGLELDMLGTVYIRTGNFKHSNSGPDVNTFGLGFRLSGLRSLLWPTDMRLHKDSLSGHIINNFELAFDYGGYFGNSSEILRGTKFFRLALSL